MTDLFIKTKAEFRRQQSDLLEVELATCSRNADLALRMFHAGNHKAAKQNVGEAEVGYATVLRLMSDPLQAKRLTIKATQDFTHRIHAVRETLDKFKRLEK